MGDLAPEDFYQQWVGRAEVNEDGIHESVIEAMAVTLDLESAPQQGDPLPPGWQWLFFNPKVRRSELGPDGHPARGGFLPPVELPRRMWAGSRVRYLADLPIGGEATKTSRILKVANKVGKVGVLCFVTVEHSITHESIECIREEQDIVYKEATPPGSALLPAPKRHDDEATWSADFAADPALLFRYSALTFNAHRIHYDLPYACKEEGYPGLVVHGPLTATLLQDFAVKHGGGRRLAEFSFRGVTPLFADQPFQLEAREDESASLKLWARGPQGELAMSATASFI